jgi:hypothetical protein
MEDAPLGGCVLWRMRPFALLNLFKKLGTHQKSKEIYVFTENLPDRMAEIHETVLAKKSANKGFLTSVSTAVE